MRNASTCTRNNQRSYSHQWAEEIKAREGGTPSPVTYDTSSPSTYTPGAPTKQKKKITWAEYRSRPSQKDHPQSHQSKQADWDERIRQQQVEVDLCQREVDRLKREQEELAHKQERLRVEQEQLEQKRQHDLEQKRQHDLEQKHQHELNRKERHEHQHLEREQEQRHLQQEEEEKLCADQECQAATWSQTPFGSHTPVHDEHGENLDYIDDVDRMEQTWLHLIADTPINKELEQSRQKQLAKEAALLRGPTQAYTAMEEDTLLSEPRPAGLNTLMQKIEDLPESALSQLSQHIDEIRWQMPYSVSPSKSPGLLPGLPKLTPLNTNMAQKILQATTHLGQLPTVTEAPGMPRTSW